MAVITDDQLLQILKTNPNKNLINQARDYSAKLSLHVIGKNINSALTQNTYFENDDVYAERNRKPTSNADLYSRLLQREEMVFSAKGGSITYPGLSDAQTKQLNARLDNIRFNMNIRKWIKEFALNAYRIDPMGVLFIEADQQANTYPTYQSSDCIWDYMPNGRQLGWICFRLKSADVKQYVPDTPLPADLPVQQYLPNYFRFVDDVQDRIVKYENNILTVLDAVPLVFIALPGVRVSDIIDFTNNQNLLSPINNTVELAETFLVDRSIRDLSKKYSGFPKGYEPLLMCQICNGTGYLNKNPCPECTPSGSDKGYGFKLRTKVADIARFEMPKAGQTGGVTDPAKYFGYITPNIETWDKQDTSLNDIEAAMNDTYWGTTNRQSTTGPTAENQKFQETATKTLADLQPIYARLNSTADWAESTENAIVDFIGQQMFPANFKESARTYGRYYILETPDELMEQYLDMKTKGAPQTQLFDTLKKYNHSLYSNDPVQLAIKLKLIDVEPFVHLTTVQLQATNPSRIDFFCKLYYSEWLATKQDSELSGATIQALTLDLITYATVKMVEPADLLTPPVVSEALTVRNID